MWASGDVGVWPESRVSGNEDGLEPSEIGTLQELAGQEVWREETRDLVHALEGIQRDA